MKLLTYIDAVNEALHEEMERDENIFVIGEDVDIDGGVWNETAGLKERFGSRRVIGTPISEAGFTGLERHCAVSARLCISCMWILSTSQWIRLQTRSPRQSSCSGIR